MNDDRDDAALVELTLAGQPEAFEPLLLRYYSSVVRLCRRLLGDTLAAQDTAQEAALQSFLNLARLHEPSRFGAWLHAIAANLARMALRRRTLSLDAADEGTPMAVLWAVRLPSPEEAHAAREVHDAIIAALNELSAVNREAVIGYYLEGYSYIELADLLGVPVSTVKGRLFFGRRQLRQALKPVADEVLKPDRRARKEPGMTTPELVEVKIDSIRSEQIAIGNAESPTPHRAVVLRDERASRILPIWIGPWEADAIEMALQGQQTARPMTHDLALRLLESLGAQVQRVVMTKLTESTFYAEVTLAQGEQQRQVDARPSDALALAARVDAPIYATQSLLDTTAGADDAAFWERQKVKIREYHEHALDSSAPKPSGE
jgi:RNA polymerase sigma factor (sigma-70 family)